MTIVRWDPFADVEAMFSRLVPARWPRLAPEQNGGRQRDEEGLARHGEFP